VYLSGFFERGSRQGLPRGKSPGDPVDDGSLTIEVFYNCDRRHSALGNVSPVNYEHLTREALAA
jgi:transposase InsO family protein